MPRLNRFSAGAHSMIISVGAITSMLASGSVQAQPQLAWRVMQPNPVEHTFFGENVAISGRHAVVSFLAEPSVSAFHFDGNDWSYEGQVGDGGGESPIIDFDLDGKWLVLIRDHSRTVEIYRHDGIAWSRERSLEFGDTTIVNDVSIRGERIAVANWGLSDAHVTVFDWNGAAWSQTSELEHDGSDSVVIDGDRMVTARTATQFVRIYQLEDGVWNPDYISGPFPYASIDLDGDTLAAGSLVLDNATGVAATFVNEAGVWRIQGRLERSFASPADLFGDSIAVNRGMIGVGSSQDAIRESRAGAARLFTFDAYQNRWIERSILSPDGLEAHADFGHAIDIDETWIMVGAPWADSNGQRDAGAVYIYRRGAFDSIDLSAPIPGMANRVNTIGAALATPGERVTFLYSMSPGEMSVPRCPGVFIDLDSPRLIDSAIATSFGHATIETFVPPGASGSIIYIQAIEPATCRASNPVQHRFD